MKTRVTRADDRLTVEPTARAPDAAIIWMHGLGADGADFLPVAAEMNLPDAAAVRFVFPNAPVRPVTLNRGYPMRAWYDILSLDARGKEDLPGLTASKERVDALIAEQLDAGIAPGRILLAGFSQGGAMALHVGLRTPVDIGGILALSTYVPARETLPAELVPARTRTPILFCHGLHDNVVAYKWGVASRDGLMSLGCDVTWKEYPMAHSVHPQEIKDIRAWVGERLGLGAGAGVNPAPA